MTHSTISPRNAGSTNSMAFWGVIFTIALMYGLMSYLTPLQYDDLMFIGAYRSNSGGSDTFSLAAWYGYCNELAQGDNRRLGNLLSPLTTLFSPTCHIFPWVNGIMAATIVVISISIARITSHRAAATSALWLLITIALPWRNNIFVADYSLNYIWSSVIALTTIALSIGYIRTQQWNVFIAAAITGTLTGWWHEGFALPVSAGLAFTGGLYPTLRRDLRWWLLVILTGGAALWAVSCPGMMERISSETLTSGGLQWETYIIDLFMVIAATLVSVLTAVSRRYRTILSSPRFIIVFVTMAAGAVMSIAVVHSPRTSFWPDLCASVVVMMLLWQPLCDMISRRRHATTLVGTLCWCVCVTQMALSILWQARINLENRWITSQMQHSPTVFIDITMPEDVPAATLLFPTRTAWIEDFNYAAHEYAFGLPDGTLAVIPTSLREASPDNSRLLTGNAGVYRCGDALWTASATAKSYRARGIDGNDLGTPGYFSRRFVTMHGDTLTYLKFHNLHASQIGTITTGP